jgi:hypothetical protein
VSDQEFIIASVWRKGRIVPGYDPGMWRMDACGAWMCRHCHGNRDSQYGWEIDHIIPTGGDHLANFQPLHWQNNTAKSDGTLVRKVTAYGYNNVFV